MDKSKKYNNLKHELSSYLMQHNQNPVDWFPYGPEALQKAKDENKPIFLSIGYSSCHWCHVMAKESFEDLETAKYLNENFINIKVDREELPDIDQYYQLACQVMTGRGGWPLSAFLTPDMKPFFVGTYFPKHKVDDSPNFMEILTHLISDFKNHNDKILNNANQIVEALKSPPKVEHRVEFQGHFPAPAAILNAIKNYQDDEHGGYGTEPKFPHFSFLEWAIEQILEGMIPQEYGQHIIKTVELIMLGGIYDHARGGIHRYSTKSDWSTPHFEKMLYDQAGLLKVLSKISLIYPSPSVFDGMIQTLDYLQNEMLSDEGYYFSAQDADSEGVEGLYFTFTKDEFIDAMVAHDEGLSDHLEKLINWFCITEEGNFERKLNVIQLSPKEKEEIFTPEGWNLVRSARAALVEARKFRIPPSTDRKGVASWNFFLLTSLLDVIQYCKIESIKQAAFSLYQKSYEKIAEAFIYTDEENRTRIKTSTTRSFHVPLFEDYLAFAEYCFRSYEVFADSNFLENATQTIHFIFKEFYKDGLFYTRSLSYSDMEEYENIHTPIFDQSYKSPLASLILMLQKWSLHSTELKEYLSKIQSLIDNLTHLSLQNPLSFGETLRALTYPEMAYKKIEIPTPWKQNPKFTQFHVNFSIRFAIVYHNNENEKWQICNHRECELQGEGIDEFISVFQVSEDSTESE